jgi:hypothetical protein
MVLPAFSEADVTYKAVNFITPLPGQMLQDTLTTNYNVLEQFGKGVKGAALPDATSICCGLITGSHQFSKLDTGFRRLGATIFWWLPEPSWSFPVQPQVCR